MYVPSAVEGLNKLLSWRLKSWLTITIYYPHSSPHVISKEMLLVNIRDHRQSRFELSYIVNEIIIEKGTCSNYTFKLHCHSSSDPHTTIQRRIVFGAYTNTVRSLLYIITNVNIILTM